MNNPKTILILILTVLTVGMVGAFLTHTEIKTLEQPLVVTAKPAPVIQWSNGFPSGAHFNLNIHGKKSGFSCDGSPGGASIFVPEYGQSLIQFIQNKKSSLSMLYVIDPCSFSASDPAKIQLPTGEYQVYARILAKPGQTKKQTEEERGVIFYPRLIDACDDTGQLDFASATDCSTAWTLGTGVITSGGVFDKDSTELVRIAPNSGNNKAIDITKMFQWTGYACDQVYDLNGDGQITIADAGDQDLDGDVDQDDLTLYLETYCSFFQNEWIFNIADLVIYGWDYNNFGSKLVQIRFYPKATTVYQ